jgi:hypothetical protein
MKNIILHKALCTLNIFLAQIHRNGALQIQGGVVKFVFKLAGSDFTTKKWTPSIFLFAAYQFFLLCPIWWSKKFYLHMFAQCFHWPLAFLILWAIVYVFCQFSQQGHVPFGNFIYTLISYQET